MALDYLYGQHVAKQNNLQIAMANDRPQEDESLDHDSTDEIAQIFQTIGNQVEGLNLGRDRNDHEDEGSKVVDEIESLCMNCGENVGLKIVACN